MQQDSQEKSRETRHWLALIVTLTLLLSPVIYTLSIGPMVARYDGTQQGRIRLAIVYAPLVWLHNHTPLKAPIDRYIDLWRS
jgi:hypothetical protein